MREGVECGVLGFPVLNAAFDDFGRGLDYEESSRIEIICHFPQPEPT